MQMNSYPTLRYLNRRKQNGCTISIGAKSTPFLCRTVMEASANVYSPSLF